MKIHTFLKKAEKRKTVCFTIENVVLGTENCMKFQYKINIKSILEKSMQKVWKMMPKGNQNESQNPLKRLKMLEKKHAKNATRI